MNKIMSKVRRFLIYMMILTVMLPVSLFASMGVASKAHAATKVIESKNSIKKTSKTSSFQSYRTDTLTSKGA